MKDIVVAITGASGSIYGVELLNKLLSLEYTVHLIVSPAGERVCEEELGDKIIDREGKYPFLSLLNKKYNKEQLIIYDYKDIGAKIASGSFKTTGMIVCPASMGILGEISSGISSNLISRAADVCLKEKRILILVTRETPLNLIHLENMSKLTKAGGIVMPASPPFYNKPKTIQDMIDFIANRICTLLN